LAAFNNAVISEPVAIAVFGSPLKKRAYQLGPNPAVARYCGFSPWAARFRALSPYWQLLAIDARKKAHANPIRFHL
jgi:hypothetical protein